MHHLILGHSFAELVALILLFGLAFYFLNKKTSVRRNAEDAETGTSNSMTALTETNIGGSSSSPTETNNGLSSSLIAPTENSYEVFLSFRGLDTRNNFTDHLYNGLLVAGIHAFRDNEELRQGEEIGPDLLTAIKNSKILIPILSENYGTSSWCLDELVQIMECKKDNTGTIVLPIFYKVAPADVRHQIGSFGKAFHEREGRLRERGFDLRILEKWKQALFEVGNLKGREANGSEVELVKSIVQQVLFELKKKFELVIPDNLVGIDSHVKKVMKFVDNNSCAPLFVGIHGMGGIGKTTLAKTIYNKISDQFKHCSFIADIRESCERKGLVYLQNKLISDILKQENQASNEDEGIQFISSKFKGKKVLILLDDVDHDDQLEALAGKHNWFSSGSMIIITTRNKSILDKARVDNQYEHEEMDRSNSLILFSRHAFRRDSPPSEFKDLTHDVVSTTGGLPLSLKVIGSFLCGRDTKVWRGTIKKLRKVPHEQVQKKLRVSYGALTHEQKQIFLDIACFFIGTDWRVAYYMWEACNFFPEVEIEVLGFLSLIKVGDDHKLTMHDQLRDLGREIVREENKMEPGKRSRLWDSKEALEVLKGDEGTEKIEAIYLREDISKGFGKTTDPGHNILTGKQFKNLRNVRFLDVRGAHFSGDFENSIEKLKWLQWQLCSPTFEANNFHVKELLVLDLCGSKISDKWQGWSSIMMARKLKYLNLESCGHLEETSFLSAFENLEVLILRHCGKIKQIDSSIGNMKSLVRLDLTRCLTLRGLPAEIGKLEALEQLILIDTRIEQLPDNIWDLQNLEILNLSGTSIEELPHNIGDLQNLEILDISCTRIKELPNGIGRLRKLRELVASFCEQIAGKMPESIRNLSSLQRLHLDSCEKLESLSVLPSSLTYLSVTCQSPSLPSLSNLTHLKELQLIDCKNLKYIGEHPLKLLEKSLNTPFELEILEIEGCTLMETLDVSHFNHLRKLSSQDILEIRGLDNLKYLENLYIGDCTSIERLDLSKSHGLKKLSVVNCENLMEIQGLDRFLQELKIRGPLIERLDLSKSEDLKVFDACYCINLVEIRGLDRMESLEKIDISGCASIVRLDLPKSKGLKIFTATNCQNLVEIQGLNRLESLEEMNISQCASIQRLDLTKSKVLRDLNVGSCKNLFEIQGLDRLEFLEELNMSGCTSFGRLPDICCFDTLHKLAINCCDNLDDIKSLERFPSFKRLWIEDYKSSAEFPNLSNFRSLRTLVLSNCHELREIPGLAELTSLSHIAIFGCSSIEILPDLSSCTNLFSLVVQNCKKLTELHLSSCTNLFSLIVQHCEKLTELRGLETLEQLGELDISGCKSLKTIPQLSRTRTDKNYKEKFWSIHYIKSEFQYSNWER